LTLLDRGRDQVRLFWAPHNFVVFGQAFPVTIGGLTMFEKLFKYPAVVSRHRDAPLAKERERYLAHRAKDGTSLGTLYRFARELLVVVREMDLRATTISVSAIESAAEHWSSHQKGRGRADQLRWSRSLFVQVAQDWLRFLGRLEEPEVEVACYAGVINDFTRFLHVERGLSAKTTRNYEWYVDKFLGWLNTLGRPLSTTSVSDVDTFISQHDSWSRVTSACCAQALRYSFATQKAAAGVPAVLRPQLKVPAYSSKRVCLLGPTGRVCVR
jgi:hypothetical protein